MDNQYIILKKVKVSGANCIAGITYGFPSITAFAGFIHNLSIQLEGVNLTSVGVLCHEHQVHAYRNSKYDPYYFAQTRNPLNVSGKTAPINEEGKMNLTVSLVIEATGINSVNSGESEQTCLELKELAEIQKLAGGTIASIEDCYVSQSACHKKTLRPLMPAFALVDRSRNLSKKVMSGQDKIDAFLEFSTLRYESTNIPFDDESKVLWKQSNPKKGYMVPVQIGYKLVADIRQAGSVQNVRDNEVPVSFVEPIHSIAEWVGTPSKLNSLDDLMWHYNFCSPFYVCHSRTQFNNDNEEELDF